MQISYSPEAGVETYSVRAEDFNWYYPSWMFRGRCFLDDVNDYAAAPSAELRLLIEAGAPWFAVLDKLIEEYPQWQEHFDAAIQRHLASQSAPSPTPTVS